MTNKTVSRWETGAYMPDLAALCRTFGVGVNALLSGQRLEDADFRRAADGNMLAALKARKALPGAKRWVDLLGGGGTGLLLSVCISLEPARRGVTAAMGFAMIVASWAIQAWMDRRIFPANAGPEEEKTGTAHTE